MIAEAAKQYRLDAMRTAMTAVVRCADSNFVANSARRPGRVFGGLWGQDNWLLPIARPFGLRDGSLAAHKLLAR